MEGVVPQHVAAVREAAEPVDVLAWLAGEERHRATTAFHYVEGGQQFPLIALQPLPLMSMA